ncbi:hypothetical protein PR048_022553 [Dryococelus australis]|uniref:Uncharacterized protein n=1 Tax=Dryococelus australis TaxID=614101 RepID=A0ABQ9H1A9_9NEOP|nr:hypothetical protein PR048_022553 [Dryococelus australis]
MLPASFLSSLENSGVSRLRSQVVCDLTQAGRPRKVMTGNLNLRSPRQSSSCPFPRTAALELLSPSFRISLRCLSVFYRFPPEFVAERYRDAMTGGGEFVITVLSSRELRSCPARYDLLASIPAGGMFVRDLHASIPAVGMFVRDLHSSIQAVWMFVRDLHASITAVGMFVRDLHASIPAVWMFVRDLHASIPAVGMYLLSWRYGRMKSDLSSARANLHRAVKLAGFRTAQPLVSAAGREMSTSKIFSTGQWGCGGVVVRLLSSHLVEPDSIPGGVAPGVSQVGIVPYDAAGPRVFSGIFSFPVPPLHSSVALSSTRFTLIGSEDFNVTRRRNQSTPLWLVLLGFYLHASSCSVTRCTHVCIKLQFSAGAKMWHRVSRVSAIPGATTNALAKAPVTARISLTQCRCALPPPPFTRHTLLCMSQTTCHVSSYLYTPGQHSTARVCSEVYIGAGIRYRL